MNELLKSLTTLSNVCGEKERALLEKMVNCAAEYVQAVIKMETAASNIAGREGETYRDTVSTLDRNRSGAHDALISSVNIVNRICHNRNLPPIYTGDEQRRHYGDFAIALVQEIFEARK